MEEFLIPDPSWTTTPEKSQPMVALGTAIPGTTVCFQSMVETRVDPDKLIVLF
jgi:hypothetical protein